MMLKAQGFADRFLSLTGVAAELNVVDDAIRRKLGDWTEFIRTTSPFDLNSVYHDQPPRGGAHPYKVAVFAPATSPSTSIIVTNLQDGWSSLSLAVAREVCAPQLQVISTGRDEAYPQQRFECWRGGTSQRVVMAMRDTDRWEFFERGKVEDFEDTSHYRQTFKRRRLTREVLVTYLRTFGWDLTNEQFWQSERDAIYFHQVRKKAD